MTDHQLTDDTTVTAEQKRQPSSESTIFMLFGATGDLAHRMVLPAFYQLYARGLMPVEWMLIGNGRGDVAHEDFRGRVRQSLQDSGLTITDGEFGPFAERLLFAGGGFDADDPGALFDVLADAHTRLSVDHHEVRYVHYLAIPPVAFGKVTAGLSEHKLLGDARVVYEKPFGTDPASFRELSEQVHAAMDESQVYRIDHFLGKEATQNLHVLRFANPTIEAIWSNEHISQVQIDVPETLDVANRAVFYDATGAFRDMIVTHLFQVAAEVAMEPPLSFGAADLQDARESVVSAFRPLDPAEAVFGQAADYLSLPDVPDDSKTETYAALKLWVDTDRWHGVPFLLRSGKQLAQGAERVTLVLKASTGPLPGVPATAVSLSMKGIGAIALSMVLKKPGPGLELTEQNITLDIDGVAKGDGLPPYVALLHDVTIGDRSLFTSSAGLENAWRVAEPLLDHHPDPISYEPGSWGPQEGEQLPGPLGWLTGSFEN